jgi:hypothetical protein
LFSGVDSKKNDIVKYEKNWEKGKKWKNKRGMDFFQAKISTLYW